jgi:hypothetical protein
MSSVSLIKPVRIVCAGVTLVLAWSCTVASKSDYTFTDNPGQGGHAAKGGTSAAGTGGSKAGAGGKNGVGGRAAAGRAGRGAGAEGGTGAVAEGGAAG